jgi:hypothetical protein
MLFLLNAIGNLLGCPLTNICRDNAPQAVFLDVMYTYIDRMHPISYFPCIFNWNERSRQKSDFTAQEAAFNANPRGPSCAHFKCASNESIPQEKGKEMRAEQLFQWEILRKVTKNLISWLKKQPSMQDGKSEGPLCAHFKCASNEPMGNANS